MVMVRNRNIRKKTLNLPKVVLQVGRRKLLAAPAVLFLLLFFFLDNPNDNEREVVEGCGGDAVGKEDWTRREEGGGWGAASCAGARELLF